MKEETNIKISIKPGTISLFFLTGILLAMCWYMLDIVLVVITSVVIASAIEPGARFFERNRVPRALGVLLMYLTLGLVISGLFIYFFPILINDSVKLLNTLPQYTEDFKLPGSLANNSSLSSLNELFSLKQILETLSTSLSNLTAGFFSTISGLFGGILSFVLIIVLSFYLSVQKDGVGEFLRIVIPLKYEPYVIGLWKRSQAKIGLWMQGQLLLGVIVAVLTYLGLSILGVENAMFLAVLAGLTEIIPIFGIVIATVPAVAIGFFQEGVTLALLVLGLYIIIQQFESHLIYPLVVKKIIGIPPILTILALVIGAKLAGFLGILLSVPVSAVLVEVLADLDKIKHPKIS